MSQSPLSILIPIYNVERYLRECLDSVVGQSQRELEIICINDGSTDSSLAIAQEYAAKDARIRIINKANSGYGHSMNRGLDAAQGEYIGIVESDDFVEAHMFEDLLALARQHDADIVRSEFFTYSSADAVSTRVHTIHAAQCGRITNIANDVSLLENATPIWNAIYKRAMLQAQGIRFLETAGASYQDTSFGFKAIACAQRMVLTDTPYLHYRIDNANSSIHQKDKVELICGEYDEIHRFLREHEDIKSTAWTTARVNEYRAYAWNMIRIDRKHQWDFMQHCAQWIREWERAGDITPAFLAGVIGRSFMVNSRANLYAFRLLKAAPSVFYTLFPLALALKKWRGKS